MIRKNLSSPLFSALILALFVCGSAFAQSTFGSFVGTVKDSSGAVVAGATITITNTATSAVRTLNTEADGSFVVPNLDPSTYELSMSKTGFQTKNFTNIVLTARQEIRIDGALSVSAQTETVTVSEASAPPITTDVSNIAETKLGRELNDLPLAIASRGNGSTSAYTTLTMQPGVETDATGSNMSIDGLKTSQMSISIDGISTMSPKSTAPIQELFPSFDNIAEIRVSEINNAAEFGGVGDITTITKSGGNSYHGGVFENNQNTDYDARNTFSATVPKLDMNDFGGFLSGPVSIPHLYNGKNKTFFFGDVEFLRRPAQTVLVDSFPTAALRSGNLAAGYGSAPILNGAGVPFVNNQIPQTMINPISQAVMNYLMPLPNQPGTGMGGIANNYVVNFPASINSDQADLRLDQQLTQNQSFNVRGTYKYKLTDSAPSTAQSPVAGDTISPEHDFSISGAYNWIITPNLFNEVRSGWTGQNTATTLAGPTAAQLVSQLGLQIAGPVPMGDAWPSYAISGFTTTSGGSSSISQTSTFQVLDNLTYNHGKHTYKFGFDFRRIYALYNNVDASDKLGGYTFNNSTATKAQIGNAFAAFLLGVPDSDTIGTITDGNATGYTKAYAGYAQDDYKVTPRLTVNYGIRYEYHPNFADKFGNIANFLPNYESVQNGVPVHGAIVVPNNGQQFINPDWQYEIGAMPVLTASQVPGLPQSLRYSEKTDFAPRIGFAWRITGDGKTVIRGGFGKYIETPLSALLDSEFAIQDTAVGQFTNSFVNGKPLYSFPYAFPTPFSVPGSLYLDLSAALHWQDPYTLQWNMTLERDLGWQTGLRISYDGNHSSNLLLEDNPNQVPANTVGYATAKAATPYPLLYQIAEETNGSRQNYDALTVAGNKRLSKGIQFNVSFNYARNLSDEGGRAPTGFVGALGNVTSDYYNPNLDYGNVAFTRRYRFLATFLYELPFSHTPNRFVNAIAGGWELSGVVVAQSGPFLTATDTSSDPAGTNQANFEGSGRTDIVSGVSPVPTNQNIHGWINTAAFALPANNIGRFGDEPVGYIIGPGTEAVSLSLRRNFRIKERVNLQIGAGTTNALNHPNYAAPATNLSSPSTFGVVSALQSVDNAGPRALQMTGRITF